MTDYYNFYKNIIPDYYTNKEKYEGIDPAYQVCDNSYSILQCSQTFAFNMQIRQPLLIPFCYLSLYVGIRSAKQAYDSKFASHRIYALLFGLTGVMMTCASITDCLLQGSGFASIIFFITDVALTSGIGIGFLFAGLIDAKIIKETKETFLLYFGVLAVLFFLWYEVVIYSAYGIGFQYIYFISVTVGCGLYLVLQLWLFNKKIYKRGFDTFILIGICGFIGIYSTKSEKVRKWICETYNCYLSGDYLWFFVTPLCIYLLKLYFLSSHKDLENTSPLDLNEDFRERHAKQHQNSDKQQLLQDSIQDIGTNNSTYYENQNTQQYMMEMQENCVQKDCSNYNYPEKNIQNIEKHQPQQNNQSIQIIQQQQPQFIYIPNTNNKSQQFVNLNEFKN